MKAFGWLMVVGGFLAGAYFASLDPDATNWYVFAPFVAIAAAGVVVLKRAEGAEATAEHVLHGNRKDLMESLDNIVERLTSLKGNKEAIPTYEMRFEIDRLFRDDLIRFADARESLKHLYGIQAYADIMSDFAAGERYLNRVWSASTDGYVDEVLTYIDRAYDQFEDAKRRLADTHAAA